MHHTSRTSVILALTSLLGLLEAAGVALAQQGAGDRPVFKLTPDRGTVYKMCPKLVRSVVFHIQVTTKGPNAWAVEPFLAGNFQLSDLFTARFLAGGVFRVASRPVHVAPNSTSTLRVILNVEGREGGWGRQPLTIDVPIHLSLWRIEGDRREQVPEEVLTYKLTLLEVPGFESAVTAPGLQPQDEECFLRAPVSFGAVAVGQSSQGTLPLWNTGLAAVSVQSLRFLGGNNSPFQMVGAAPPFTLAALECRELTLSVTPRDNSPFDSLENDTYRDVLEIGTNDPLQPTVWVEVEGTRPRPSSTGTVPVLTGEGTENRIEWKVGEAFARGAQVPRDQEAPIAGLPSFDRGKPGGGIYQSLWRLTPDSGLLLKEVQFVQEVTFGSDAPLLTDPATGKPRPHRLAEELQWRHSRVVFEAAGLRQEIPIPLRPILFERFFPQRVTEPRVYLQTQEGTRTFDKKKFAWAVGGFFEPVIVADPTGADVAYLISVQEDFAVSTPEADQGPGESAVAIKLFPTLTVRVNSSQPTASVTRPGFAADLKMVFAPRLTRHDQHRSSDLAGNSTSPDPGGALDDPTASQYLPKELRDTNVATLVCDTNHESRPIPNELPERINWRTLFDYVEPDLLKEKSFDAVVWPRARVNGEKEFRVYWPAPSSRQVEDDMLTSGVEPTETHAFPLRMKREPGQGQFDNLHIHPYVGYDVPAGADLKSLRPEAARAMIEAPLGADEEVHMHWRWGTHVPRSGEILADHDDPAFKGYSADPNDKEPWHKVAGAPLIPANQSLRLRITDPAIQNADEPLQDTRLDHRTTAVWYRAEVHQADLGNPSQFCVHGVGMAYHLVPSNFLKIPGLPLLNNKDLLGAPVLTGVPSYHSFRWDNRLRLDRQRVPKASGKGLEGLEYNWLGIPGPNNEPPVEKDVFDPLGPGDENRVD